MLDTTNPHHYVYDSEELLLEIMGGLRMNQLSSMQVTLKLTNKINDYELRHSVDLYNHTSVERLTRLAAEHLEHGTTAIRKELLQLTKELEAYRISFLEQEAKYNAPNELTEKEKSVAQAFLSQDNLLDRTNEMIGASGVIGEENNRLLMYLIYCSRKMNNPLHVISLGSSGSGKTHLQSSVAELIPEEDKIEVTLLSEQAFYYFGREELKHKLILIEDMDGAQGVLYPLRELKSKHHISKTVVHRTSRGTSRTIHLRVEGPVCIAGCTTQESIYEDNANRSFLIYIDESKDQDEKIMAYQRSHSAGKINKSDEVKAKQFLQKTQSLLHPIKVINPYAEVLRLPSHVFKPRRSNAHYLQFIAAITFYHQHQRKQEVDESTGEVFIESTIADIEAANELIKEVLLRKSDRLNGACRRYYEKLKIYTKQEGLKQFTTREVALGMRKALSSVKRYHKSLFDNGYLLLVPMKGSKAHYYMIDDYNDYKNLEKAIDEALGKAITMAEAMNNPKPKIKSERLTTSSLSDQ